MWKEFKAFAFKGNVLDLAIGVVIGAAFGKIVTSIVNDLITPIIGIIIGGLNFSGLALEVGDSKITYGNLIQTIIDFLLTAASIFLFIKLLGRFKKKEEEKPAAPPVPSREEMLLTEIRDLLKQQRQES
ncbi:mechanosensitive ion channel protein MscL [Paenibacillus yonginensis]|uniref:Large-conductance mechanosensitive channel n=1 Tax=Paenibacillus yonginensis TaxID=1462996 RepID=A0A1B1MXQ2_9BACL|nr:large conductance mechanosensitive channel protein MscL [Paenibacillus yonginensis]ANS73962.1 mechanosensitive ion channel protein MscL [Paenibacillus yonginensis]